MTNLYAERDIMAQGDYYSRHTSAMTGEDLHSKSDIAAELAHRDIRIAVLEADNDHQRERRDAARACIKEMADQRRELERQVLGLREAVGNCSRHAIANDVNTDRFAEMVREVLEDTAQAGREAEAEAIAIGIEKAADYLNDHSEDEHNTRVLYQMAETFVSRRMEREAARLRTEGDSHD